MSRLRQLLGIFRIVYCPRETTNGVTHSSAMQHPVKNPLPRDLANTYEGVLCQPGSFYSNAITSFPIRLPKVACHSHSEFCSPADSQNLFSFLPTCPFASSLPTILLSGTSPLALRQIRRRSWPRIQL